DGVVAVLTHTDLANPQVFFPGFAALFASDQYHRRPLATDTVRFVGDIVAIVVATSPGAAEDAADLVDVTYEPLPSVVEPEAAAAPDAPLLFPGTGTNVAVDSPYSVGAPSDDATVNVHQVVHNHRMAVAPMEGNAVVAVPDAATGAVTAHLS